MKHKIKQLSPAWYAVMALIEEAHDTLTLKEIKARLKPESVQVDDLPAVLRDLVKWSMVIAVQDSGQVRYGRDPDAPAYTLNSSRIKPRKDRSTQKCGRQGCSAKTWRGGSERFCAQLAVVRIGGQGFCWYHNPERPHSFGEGY